MTTHLWVLPLLGSSVLALVLAEVDVAYTTEDEVSLLQHHVAERSGPASAASAQIIPNPDVPTENLPDPWRCREGDVLLAFHNGRDCSDFKEEELDLPMSTWPYMTRWCKLAHRDPSMLADQCMAQHCIERGSPSLAAKIWWDTKTSQSELWQNVEFPYCNGMGFCRGHPLAQHNTTLEDMESFCNNKFQDRWKKLSPRDTLEWMKKGVGDIEMLTCSWGTLHCDVARCNQYLCGPKAQQTALLREKTEVKQRTMQLLSTSIDGISMPIA